MDRQGIDIAPFSLDEINSKLCEVMDDIGVTVEMVLLRRYIYLMNDVRFPINNMSFYYIALAVGTQVEGSTTLGMNSDEDKINVSPYVKVILHGQSIEMTE